MREILFRGFTPDEKGQQTITVNGKEIKGLWVQGSYWELQETTYCFKEDYDRYPDNTKHYIVFDRMTDWGLPNRHLQADVIPETVGQYTGLTDKNGTKIFEGDIIETHSGLLGKIVYGTFFDDEYEADSCGWFWIGKDQAKYTYKLSLSDFWDGHKVIGNIYDNPELLGGDTQ